MLRFFESRPTFAISCHAFWWWWYDSDVNLRIIIYFFEGGGEWLIQRNYLNYWSCRRLWFWACKCNLTMDQDLIRLRYQANDDRLVMPLRCGGVCIKSTESGLLHILVQYLVSKFRCTTKGWNCYYYEEYNAHSHVCVFWFRMLLNLDWSFETQRTVQWPIERYWFVCRVFIHCFISPM